jgi:hypothetical protein
MNILKNKLAISLFALGMMLTGGVVAGATAMASAQTTATTTAAPVSTVAEATTAKPHGHAPLGGDGVVSSVSGTTIVMAEESDEGSASYTVDASKATVTTNGAAGTLADIKVGEKIFVQGTVSGTGVSATSISVGHPGEYGKDKANDSDGSAASETSEPASSTSSDQ